MVPCNLKMEVWALGLVQIVKGPLDFLSPSILQCGSGFRREVAGGGLWTSSAPSASLSEAGRPRPPWINSRRSRPSLEENSLGRANGILRMLTLKEYANSASWSPQLTRTYFYT